ncbi:hypothetical protein WG922_04815 [Ramlibacter sp. AN1015]|uniref:hypothetical protein n=1 Tax=Ramlibacter sp. AN1015 TaxID=3133428 RepID=UPI0030C47484
MKHARTKKHSGRRGLLAFGAAALLAVAASAQVANLENQSAREQLQACRSGATWQARENCVREVQAAQQARRAGTLASAEQYTANALARCNIYREQEDVMACRGRVMGLGEVTGSVTGGGLLRQYEYLVPAEPQAGTPRDAEAAGAARPAASSADAAASSAASTSTPASGAQRSALSPEEQRSLLRPEDQRRIMGAGIGGPPSSQQARPPEPVRPLQPILPLSPAFPMR